MSIYILTVTHPNRAERLRLFLHSAQVYTEIKNTLNRQGYFTDGEPEVTSFGNTADALKHIEFYMPLD